MRSIILKHSNKIKNTCTPKKAVLQALFHFRMVGFGRRGSGIDSGKINSTLNQRSQQGVWSQSTWAGSKAVLLCDLACYSATSSFFFLSFFSWLC